MSQIKEGGGSPIIKHSEIESRPDLSQSIESSLKESSGDYYLEIQASVKILQNRAQEINQTYPEAQKFVDWHLQKIDDFIRYFPSINDAAQALGKDVDTLWQQRKTQLDSFLDPARLNWYLDQNRQGKTAFEGVIKADQILAPGFNVDQLDAIDVNSDDPVDWVSLINEQMALQNKDVLKLVIKVRELQDRYNSADEEEEPIIEPKEEVAEPTIEEEKKRSGLARVREAIRNIQDDAGDMREAIAEVLEREIKKSVLRMSGGVLKVADKLADAPQAVAKIIERSQKLGTALGSEKTTRRVRSLLTPSTLKAGILTAGLVLGSARPAGELSSGQPEDRATQETYLVAKRIAGLKERITQPVVVSRREVVLDKEVIYPGSQLYTEDIVKRITELSQVSPKHVTNERMGQAITTIRLLSSAKQLYPQAVKFMLKENNDNITIVPVDWQNKIEVKKEVNNPFIVIGGELESLAAAMRLATKGKEVSLIYAGVLGGLNADRGKGSANMRYFDYVDMPISPEQRQIHQAIGRDRISVDDNVAGKLEQLIRNNYPNIHLYPTTTLNSIHVDVGNDQVRSLVTQEGIRFVGTIIDASPEDIIAEKVGLPIETGKVNMPPGVVFDVNNLDQKTMDKLGQKITPDMIFALAHKTRPEIEKAMKTNVRLKQTYDWFNKLNNNSIHRPGTQSSYGYHALAGGFQLYGLIRELDNPNLRRINNQRVSTGFNAALHPQLGTVSFNSISYHLPKAQHQGDNNLHTDPQFAGIRDDMRHLEYYFQSLAGNQNLKLRMPEGLYVREPRIIQTAHMAGLENVLTPQPGALYRFKYHNDNRGAPNNPISQLSYKLKGEINADITVAQTQTHFRNFYVTGKGAGSKSEVSPWARIQQGMIAKNVTLADYLVEGNPIPPLAGSITQMPNQYISLLPNMSEIEKQRQYWQPNQPISSVVLTSLAKSRGIPIQLAGLSAEQYPGKTALSG